MGYAIFNSGGGADVKTLKSLIDRSATDLVIPASVDNIGKYAFAGCAALESVRFLGDILTISPNAFDGCFACRRYDFTACTMVPQLLSYSAFQDISNDAYIYVPAYLYEDWVAEPAWNKYEAYIVAVDVTVPEDPVYTEGLEYVYDDYTKSYIVSKGSWEGEEELRIPPTHKDETTGIEAPVHRIEYNGFAGMTMIKRVYADGLTGTNGSPFDGCTEIEYLSVKGFDGFASFEFSGLTSLKEVIFGDVRYEIGWGAFNYCTSTCRFDLSQCTKVPHLGEDALGSLTEGAQIVVPAALYDEWKNNEEWAVYADFIVSADA